MNVRAVFTALLSAAALYLCTVQPANAAPALWVAKSPVAKVYLFGTVHVLRPGIPWRSPQLDAAIDDSQELYLEIADPANVKAGLSSVVKTGFDREHPLSTKISKADEDLLIAASKRYGFGNAAMFDLMRPWLAYVMLSVMPLVRSGYSTNEGVDLQIRKDFVRAGKPIRGFETFDMQTHFFADLPEATQVQLLDSQLKALSKGNDAKSTDDLVSAWQAGNQDQLASMLGTGKSKQSLVEQRLLSNRNKAWADILAERLKRPGTSLVCVGAAHLVGPDGLPSLLSGLGFEVSRVPTTEPAAPAANVSPAASPQANPSPAPTSSTTPVPQTITPPPGWNAHAITFTSGGFTVDRSWVAPAGREAILTGHVDVPGGAALDLDSVSALMREGLTVAAGSKGVGPSQRVRICRGTQDGTYSKVTLTTVKEDLVLAVSDRAYVAEYVRSKDQPDDAAATKALLTLCAP
jgi:uncharacterized protein YbaP (TraB family)